MGPPRVASLPGPVHWRFSQEVPLTMVARVAARSTDGTPVEPFERRFCRNRLFAPCQSAAKPSPVPPSRRPLNDPVRRAVLRALALAGALARLSGARAIGNDAKLGDVRLIVPYPENGAADRLGRLLATFLERYLDATVNVVNLPGMGGVTGMDAVATATADGRTLGLAVSTPIVSATLLKRPRAYDVFRDFDWLGIVGTYANAMVVSADAPSTLASWIEWARAQRRPLRYATPGAGTAAHFSGEFLRQTEGLDLVHEAFTTVADAYPKLDDRSIAVVFDGVPARSTIRPGRGASLP